MANADVAWVDVLPSARNFLPQLQQAVTPAAAKAGEAAGRQFGTSFGSSSTSSVEAASSKMSAALRKVQDAAGQVRVAEEKLNVTRESGKANSAQIAAAEERLATARRNETGANENLALATRRVASAQTEHTNAVRSSSGAMDEGTKRAGVMSTAFSGMRNAVATGFAAFYGAKVAVDFIGSTISASRDLNEEINKSSVVFGTSATKVLNWSKTTATSLGTSREQALQAAGTFGNLFSAIGLTTDVSADMSIHLVKLAADLASFNNADPSDVLEAMRAGLVGETEPMRRFGIDISDASMRAEALKEGLNVGPVLTQSQKAQLAYAIIVQQTGKAQGDFQRTSDSLANSQRILSATWDDAKAKMGALLVGPATTFVHWLTDAIPKVMELGHWIGENVNWLGPLAGIILGVAAAVKVWSSGQAILNAVMEANPIIRIIGIILALATALVTAYQTSETFRNIVDAVFHAIADAAMWLWTNGIKPAFDFIMAHWGTVAAFLQATWDNVLHPVWNAVAAVATWLWANVLQPTFTYIGDHWRTVVDAMVWAWANVLQPAWTVLATVATWLWTNVLQPTFAFIATAWTAMVTVMKDVWDNVLHPMWDLLVAVLQLIWVAVIKPIFDLIQIEWTLMVNAMKLAWDIILHPMWDLLSATAQIMWNVVLKPIFELIGVAWNVLLWGMKTLYDNVLHPMLVLFGNTVTGLKGIFEVVTKAIEVVWNTVMDIVATPINFVIEVIFNRGLFTAWNWVVDTLGLPKDWHAPHWDQVSGHGTKFADGGQVPAYAAGGTIPGPYRGPRADNMPGYVPMAGGGFAPIRVNPREFIEPVAAVDRYGLDFMESVRTGRFPVALARGFADGGVWKTLDAWRAANLPGSVLTSAYRPGANDYHGSGEAIDIGVPGNVQSTLDSMALKVLSAWGYANEIIHKPNVSVKNGQKTNPPAPWGQSVWDQHANHIHLAVTAANLAGHGGPSQIGSGITDIAQIWDKLTSSISAVGEMVGRFGNNTFVQMMAKLPVSLLGKMWDTVKDTVSNAIQTVVTAVVGGNTLTSGTGRVQDDVRIQANKYGWGSGAQWNGIDYIVSHESGWNPTAQNPSSSASGLFQMIDSTWAAYRPASAAAFAHMKQASVPDQGAAGMRYISARYGDPVKAQAFWQAHHYYGDGGQIPYFHTGGSTRGWRRDHAAMLAPDERVLSAREDDYFRRFVEALESHGYGGPAGGRGPLVGQVVQAQGESTEAFVDRLWHKVRVADRGGVYTFTA